MDYYIFYKQISEKFVQIIKSPENLDVYCNDMLGIMLSITSDDKDAVEIKTNLFLILYNTIAYLKYNIFDKSFLKNACSKLNTFALRYNDLNTFVEIVWASGCIPYEWAQLCNDTGINTDNWNICEN